MADRAAILIATLVEPPVRLEELTSTVGLASWLEVRADLAGDIAPSLLRTVFEGPLLYTYRSRAEGGDGEVGGSSRADRLIAAGREYDFVDLEVERDLQDRVLEAIPESRRLLSWHGPADHLSVLHERLTRMDGVGARYRKLVVDARRSGEDVLALDLLLEQQRSDVVAFAMGEMGTWTRLLAPRLGAPLVYAALDRPAAAGQLTVERLERDFGLPDLPPIEACYGVVGNPVAHSLSPRLHNGAYRATGVPALYLPFLAEHFGRFWLEVVESGIFDRVGAPLRGLSITSPHKDAALAAAGAPSPLAQGLGSANTLLLRDGVWEAESTDPDGVLGPLRRRGAKLDGARAAVVGCGGAGRAAAAGLKMAGCELVVTNRNQARGEEVAESLGTTFVPLLELDPGDYDVLVQATSLGMKSADPLPFDPERIGPSSIVIEMVYASGPTPLVRRCRERQIEVVEGREVLLHQALEQFRLMTGVEMPFQRVATLLGVETALQEIS